MVLKQLPIIISNISQLGDAANKLKAINPEWPTQNGALFNKSPTGNSKNLLYNILHKKKRQADNFIIDISKVELNEAEIMEQAESVYRNEHTRFVKELILVKDGKIVYQRKR